MNKDLVIYPGTFDPVTNGHSDLIHRAAQLFPRVMVAVADNGDKAPLFSLDERINFIKAVTTELDNVDVRGFDCLLIDFARKQGAKVILRGLRAVSDFEYEFQLASMNRTLDAEIETIFLTPAEQCAFISSSLVKEIAAYGGRVDDFVHPVIAKALQNK